MASDDHRQVGEAKIERSADGLRPVGEGWFVVNVAELAARRNERMGITCSPEPEDARFAEFGFHLRVLEPRQFNARCLRLGALGSCPFESPPAAEARGEDSSSGSPNPMYPSVRRRFIARVAGEWRSLLRSAGVWTSWT